MLERMFFDVTRGGVHSQIDVWVEDGKVFHKARLFGAVPEPGLREDEPYPYGTEWLMRLSRLNMGALETSYRAEQPEDVVWTLHWKDQGTEEIRSNGIGAYPPGWDAFLLLMDELAPEAEFIDPELIETLHMTFRSTEDTDFGPQEYTEEMTLDRRSQKLLYRRSFADDIYVQTEYRNLNEVSLGLDLWDRLFTGASPVSMDSTADREPPHLDVLVDRHDGSQERFLWHYNRTCLPEQWPRFIGSISHRLQLSTMFINMIAPAVYLHGAREGELIYCTVRISAVGRSFYYLTNDNSLTKGDKVLVPFGEYDQPTSGEITKVEYFLPEHVPHPVEETRAILGRDPSDEK